jgi:hypothetical protein
VQTEIFSPLHAQASDSRGFMTIERIGREIFSAAPITLE